MREEFVLAKHIGVDLGTANSLIFCKGKGVVLNEPSVVAVHGESGRVLAVGKDAKEMIGRTPDEVLVMRPMQDGVIADLEATQAMLKAFLDKAATGGILRPQVTICVPYGVTDVERRAVLEAVVRAGGKNAYVLEEPMAAALGAELPVQEATGSMVVDIGGGTCEVAVVSFGGIVTSTSIRYAGDKMDADIIDYAKETHNLLIGARTAEEIKISIGTAHPACDEVQMSVMGRDLSSGLPRMITISSAEIQKAILPTVNKIIGAVRTVLEHTPPELAADIVSRGIVLTGGGARLSGLDALIREQTGISACVAENAELCVAVGAGFALSRLAEKRWRAQTSKRFLFGRG